MAQDGRIEGRWDIDPYPLRQLELFTRTRTGTLSVSGRSRQSRVPSDAAIFEGLVMQIHARMPGAVICMISAASLHDLLPGPSTPLWIGVPTGVHVPLCDGLKIQALRWSNSSAFEVGVEEIQFRDVTLIRTTRVRTIVDLVRYRRRLAGSTAAARCLRTYLAEGGHEEDIQHMARLMRISQPAQIVLDALFDGLDAQS